MFSHLIVDVASVILAASGLGALGGGVAVTFRHRRPVDLTAEAGRQIREAGYFGAGVGVLALFLDLIRPLY